MHNPCNGCQHSYKYKSQKRYKYIPSYSELCMHCDRKAEYEIFKLSKRKYKAGAPIKSMKDFNIYVHLHTHIMFFNSTMHVEAIKNWQYSTIEKAIKNLALREAIKTDTKEVINY